MSAIKRLFDKVVLLFAFAAAAAFANTAGAVPCGTGLHSSDFTFRGGEADACIGPFRGNPNTLKEFNDVLDSSAEIDGEWNLFLSASAGGSVSTDWNGFRFTFLATTVIGPKPASGNFWLTVKDLNPGTPPEYPITFDLLLAPKAGNQWAGYLFEDEEFTLDDTGSGNWLISFNNNNSPNGQSAGLSHMNFLLRDFSGSECLQDCNPPGGPPRPGTVPLPEVTCERGCNPPGVTVADLTVPEPATMALLGIAVVGLAASRRRKRS